jgi:hypothetical protein
MLSGRSVTGEGGGVASYAAILVYRVDEMAKLTLQVKNIDFIHFTDFKVLSQMKGNK